LPRISGEKYLGEPTRFVSRDPLGYVDGMGLYGAYFVPNAMDPYGLSWWGIDWGAIFEMLANQVKAALSFKLEIKTQDSGTSCCCEGEQGNLHRITLGIGAKFQKYGEFKGGGEGISCVAGRKKCDEDACAFFQGTADLTQWVASAGGPIGWGVGQLISHANVSVKLGCKTKYCLKAGFVEPLKCGMTARVMGWSWSFNIV
jgi:hypothetical protein